MFYSKGSIASWKKLSSIKCGPEPNKQWLFDEKTPVTADDNVICAKKSPCAPYQPQSKCPADLPAFVGCEEINAPKYEMNCAANNDKDPLKLKSLKLYVTEGSSGTWHQTFELVVCDHTGKWTAKAIKGRGAVDTPVSVADSVVCAKRDPAEKSCITTRPLDFKCGDTDNGCKEVTLTDIEALSCNPGKNLFFKKVASGDPWKDAKKIQCNVKSGTWEQGDSGTLYTMAATDKVVCADKLPSTNCITTELTGLCDNSKIKNTQSFCEDVIIDTNAALKCATTLSPDLYYKEGADWKTATVTCDKSDGKWKAGGTPLASGTNVICVLQNPNWMPCRDMISEFDKGVININAKAQRVFPNSFLIEDPLRCPAGPPAKTLHYLSASGWKEATTIQCNLGSGDWEEGGVSLPQVTNVVCAEENPGPVSCESKSPLKTACDPTFPGTVGCTEVTFANEAASPCADKYFVKQDSSSDPTLWQLAVSITCDNTKGQWRPDLTPQIFLKENDRIICAKASPNPQTTTCAPPLPNPSCTGLVDCVEVPTGDLPDCPKDYQFYFKLNAEAKWMAAGKIECEGEGEKKWKIYYKYGIPDKDDEFAPDKGKIICAKANPEPEVCKFETFTIKRENLPKYEIDNVDATMAYAAGQPGVCRNKVIEFMSEKDPLTVNPDHVPPVCDPDGTWHFNDESIGKKHMACVMKNCKSCDAAPTISDPGVTLAVEAATEISQGECANLKCSGTPMFAMKIAGDAKYWFSNEAATCNEDKKWQFKNNLVEKISCVQRMPCLDDNFLQVDLMECPPEFETKFGCEKVEKDTSDAEQHKLKCTTATKKMFVKSVKAGQTGQFWAELKQSTPTCDHLTNKWTMDIINIYPDRPTIEDSRGPHNAFICADVNPNPEPTTTTTTTTPAPILPICEVCNGTGVLPEAIGCDKCDRNHFKLKATNDDECEMTSDSKDYKIVINSMEEVSILICKRDANPKWTKVGGTEAIVKVDARVEQKRDKLLPMAYGIIAGAIVLIGGMAIAFVMIYIKMRKQSSERENKKKERGVTKKYTASNVMKTGGKSGKKSGKKSGSKEAAGTSKEATSKAEDNLEDAPTLKL